MQSNGKALCAFLKNDKKTVRQFTPVVDLPRVTLYAAYIRDFKYRLLLYLVSLQIV